MQSIYHSTGILLYCKMIFKNCIYSMWRHPVLKRIRAFLCHAFQIICWRWCLMVVLETFWAKHATFPCNSPTVILAEFFAPPQCAWGQNKHGSSSRQFCYSSSCFELFKYFPNGRYGHFQGSGFFSSHSLTYEVQHTFPTFDLCVL